MPHLNKIGICVLAFKFNFYQTLHLFLEMILSILGLMSFPVATFNTETRCCSVLRDLWAVLFSFITENICSYE